MKPKTMQSIARVSTGLCAVAGMVIVVLAAVMLEKGTALLVVVFALPVVSAILQYAKRRLMMFVSGALNCAAGFFLIANEIISALSSSTDRGFMPYIVYLMGILLIEGGVFAIMWYRSTGREDSTFAEFEIISEDAGQSGEDKKDFTIEKKGG